MAEDISISIAGTEIPEESVLLERLKQALGRGHKKVTFIDGYTVDTDSNVRMLTGPVLGEVTQNKAIILLEVTGPDKLIPIKCALYQDDEKDDPVEILEKEARQKRPIVFEFEDLEPGTEYTAVFNGVCKYNATNRMAKFRTLKEADQIKNFRLFALSCDRPSRLLLGQQDPWFHMLKRSKNIDCILHVGDQIYPDNEDIAHADNIFNSIYDSISEEKQRSMNTRGRELWRNKYRNVFSREHKMELMAKVPNLMIWSDNDVANDFTTMKTKEGEQKYHPEFLKCGMRTYREYQRRLWDPNCELSIPDGEEVAEWHSHVFGAIGIFMFDLRGNRIDGQGKQMSDNPLISDAQWEDLEAFFQNPDLRVIILCSETPFVGDEPSECQRKVSLSHEMDFLKDHWPYNEDELIRLLDLCFTWKGEGEKTEIGRDILMIGGDIHCGVTSVIRDEESGLQINHLTTSPVTNHVCKFFPSAGGSVSDRYDYSHLPLGQKFRNYADVNIAITDDDVHIQAKLVPISTDIFKDTSWQVDMSDED